MTTGSVWDRLRQALQPREPVAKVGARDRKSLEVVWRRRAEALAKPAESLDAGSGAETPVLIVKVGEESYGLPLAFLREIQKITSITKVPGVPAFVLGIINLRGEVVSVLDPAALLNVAGGATIGKESRIVVAEVGGIVVGMRVERVLRIAMVPPSAVRPRMAGAGDDGVPLAGVVTHQGEVYPLVDLERMLDAQRIVVQHEA